MTVCLSPNGQTVTECPAAPNRVVVATIRGVAVIERPDAGGAWRVVRRTLEDRHVGSLVVLPDGRLIAGAHNGGVHVSDDDGKTWRERSDGIDIPHVFSLALARPDGTVLYAGTEPVSLYRSTDGAESWQALPEIGRVPGTEHWTFPGPPHVAHTKSLTFDRRNPDTVFAAIEQGALLKSTDGGVSWRELESYYRSSDKWYRDVHRIVQMPSNPDELFMTTGMGLYRSVDFGESWKQLTDFDCRIAYPDHLIAAPQNDDFILMSGAVSDPSRWHTTHAANGTVLKSEDRGRTWHAADRGLPSAGRANIEAMCAATHDGGFTVFVGNTDGEVYMSDDAAETWTRIADGLAPVSKVGHYRNLQTAAA